MAGAWLARYKMAQTGRGVINGNDGVCGRLRLLHVTSVWSDRSEGRSLLLRGAGLVILDSSIVMRTITIDAFLICIFSLDATFLR